MSDKARGLYRKFDRISRADGSSEPGGKHDGCEYFVLDLTHDRYASRAIEYYARLCSDENPALSDDLLLTAQYYLRRQADSDA